MMPLTEKRGKKIEILFWTNPGYGKSVMCISAGVSGNSSHICPQTLLFLHHCASIMVVRNAEGKGSLSCCRSDKPEDFFGFTSKHMPSFRLPDFTVALLTRERYKSILLFISFLRALSWCIRRCSLLLAKNLQIGAFRLDCFRVN